MKDIKNSSLREVMNLTRNIPIQEGGLAVFLEKIVEEIEYLKKQVNNENKPS